MESTAQNQILMNEENVCKFLEEKIDASVQFVSEDFIPNGRQMYYDPKQNKLLVNPSLMNFIDLYQKDEYKNLVSSAMKVKTDCISDEAMRGPAKFLTGEYYLDKIKEIESKMSVIDKMHNGNIDEYKNDNEWNKYLAQLEDVHDKTKYLSKEDQEFIAKNTKSFMLDKYEKKPETKNTPELDNSEIRGPFDAIMRIVRLIMERIKTMFKPRTDEEVKTDKVKKQQQQDDMKDQKEKEKEKEEEESRGMRM